MIMEPRHAFGQRKFWLGVTWELMQLLQLAWSDKWYLDATFVKMLQLSLELVAKHGRLVAGLVPAADEKSGAAPPVWEASASPPSWASSSAAARIPRFAMDLVALSEELSLDGFVAALVLSRTPETGADKTKDLVQQLLQETRTSIQGTVDVLGDILVKQVSSVVLPQFAAIRGIPAFYRMLNKPVPEVASPYVQAAMAPVEAFHKAAPATLAGPWLNSILDAVSTEFALQSVQLLEATKQQEASLRRLSGRATTGDAQVSDLEKIHIQLCLDIDTFIKLAAAMGASTDAANMTQLTEAVAQVWPTYLQHRPAGVGGNS